MLLDPFFLMFIILLEVKNMKCTMMQFICVCMTGVICALVFVTGCGWQSFEHCAQICWCWRKFCSCRIRPYSILCGIMYIHLPGLYLK